jgi:poly-gamma-glutamate system protein
MNPTTASHSKKTRFLLVNGLISLIILFAISFIPEKEYPAAPPEFREAAKIMEESLEIISSYCRENNLNMDELADPGKTGLIGPEMTEITTSIGHLEAKRTTINPNFAALLVSLLMEAGVEKNDTIAITCSGSFPALLIASLSAAKAMKLNPRVILSIGSSSYGATNINFTLLDIYEILRNNRIVNSKPIAVSLGGTDDIGSEFEEEVTALIQSKIDLYGTHFIYESDLQSNVKKRESLFFPEKGVDIKAFINAGGGYASMGTSSLILTLPPGLVWEAPLPEKNSRGVIYSMLDRGIPVIHLLFIKGIAQKYNLMWDPVSLPEYREHNYRMDKSGFPGMAIVSIFYLVYFSFILIRYNRLNNMK